MHPAGLIETRFLPRGLPNWYATAQKAITPTTNPTIAKALRFVFAPDAFHSARNAISLLYFQKSVRRRVFGGYQRNVFGCGWFLLCLTRLDFDKSEISTSPSHPSQLNQINNQNTQSPHPLIPQLFVSGKEGILIHPLLLVE